jgi:hypothetical protein
MPSSYALEAEGIAATMEGPAPQQPVYLEPGETREHKHYQNQTIEDVQVKLIRTAVYSVAFTLVSIVPTVLVDAVPWYAPLCALPVTGLWAWVSIDKKGFKRLISLEKLTRIDLNGDGQIGDDPPAPPITIEHKHNQDGKLAEYTYPQILTPRVGGRPMLARWFARIVARGGEGFSINVAQKYKIQRDEVKTLQKVFDSEGWTEENTGNKTIPNAEGLDVMRDVIAEVYPPA